MKRGKFIFITGGARSGKSSFAEKVASCLGEDVTYIATAEVLDEEMAARVAEHRLRRPPGWRTIEEPRRVATVLEKIGQKDGVVIIDCLTLLIANLLFPSPTDGDVQECQKEKVLQEIRHLARVASSCRAHVIIVSNELGLGVVPPYPQGRIFRDVTGWSNQIMAREADHAFFLISGMAVDIKALHREPESVLDRKDEAGG